MLRDGQELHIQPKALGVLWALVQRAGEVVSRDELLDAVWPMQDVGEATLTFQIKALRMLLGDDARKPRYIGTVHRIGYRFLAPVRADWAPHVNRQQMVQEKIFVGRTDELERVRSALKCASAGSTQFVFVTGDAGIGKSRFVAKFLEEAVKAPAELLIGKGGGTERKGAVEPFAPIIECLEDLMRTAHSSLVLDTLQGIAPSWLQNLSSMLDEASLSDLRKRTAGVKRTQMLHELATALETLGQNSPVILVLEDLQWSDPSTIDALRFLAEQTPSARLLVLCTFRPGMVQRDDHPVRNLQADLLSAHTAQAVALELFSRAESQAYIERALAKEAIGSGTIERLSALTVGHPLFLAHVIHNLSVSEEFEHALQEDEKRIPARLQDFLAFEIEKMAPSMRLTLEAAAAAGMDFSSAGLAAMIGNDPVEIEGRCKDLIAAHPFITEQRVAIWPDGTASGTYKFRHALYRSSFLRRISAERRVQIHRRLAERLEQAYGSRTQAIAGQLFEHFQQGGCAEQAVRYGMIAARQAFAKSGDREARLLIDGCLPLLESLPEGRERSWAALALAILQANIAFVGGGYGTEMVQQHLVAMGALVEQVDDPALQVEALALLWLSAYFRSDNAQARAWADRMLALGEERSDPATQCMGLAWLGNVLQIEGAQREAARVSQMAVDLAEAHDFDIWTSTNAEPGCAAGTSLALSQWEMGLVDQALESGLATITRAERLENPYMLCATRGMTLPTVRLYRREFDLIVREAPEVLELCLQFGHMEGFGWMTKSLAIARAMLGEFDEGLAILRATMDAQRAAGSIIAVSVDCAFEAEICLAAGRLDEAGQALDSAYKAIEASNERRWEPEIWRLKGQWLAATGGDRSGIESSFAEATRTAQAIGALSFELRTAMARVRFQAACGDGSVARRGLETVLSRFSEGFSTQDLRDAQALMADI